MNTTSLQKKAPVFILVLLVAAMLISIAYQAYVFFAPSTEQPLANARQGVSKNVEPTPSAQEPSPRIDINQLQLFGNPSESAEQKPAVATENLPKTNLRLVLRGVSASSDVERVSALIEGPDKETQKYAINDKLPGNAKLKSVHEKRIVIERNGRLENLYFPEDSNIGIVRNENPEGDGNNRRNTSPQRAAQSIPTPQQFRRPAVNLDTLSEERKQEIKHRLEQLREKMKQSQ